MLIPRKGKGQPEIYKCKLGIHDWVTEHWWETQQKPRRAIFSHKGGRKRAQYYNKYYPKNKPCVCHKDNDRTNNRVENLYWGTYKENTQQCIQDGRFKPGGRDILDEFSINCLLYEYNLGKPRSILKKKFGISDSAITRIINLKSKPKFGNYKFKAIYQDIMNDYQEGMLVRDICNKYSIGHTTLNNYLRRLNIVRHR